MTTLITQRFIRAVICSTMEHEASNISLARFQNPNHHNDKAEIPSRIMAGLKMSLPAAALGEVDVALAEAV